MTLYAFSKLSNLDLVDLFFLSHLLTKMNYISICKSNDPLNIFARATGLNASRDRILGGGGGGIRGPSDIQQFLNPTSTTISLRLIFNSR